MSFNTDGLLDIDEVLRIAELAICPKTGSDMFMVVEAGGAPVEGECPRAFADGKPHLEVYGYWNFTRQVQQGTDKKYKASGTPLIVVRPSDVATASLYSLLNNGRTDVKVTLQVFRAGGQNSSTELNPYLELIGSEARIYAMASYTSERLAMPCGVVVCAFRKLQINSAQQQTSGLRGAVRTCSMTQ